MAIKFAKEEHHSGENATTGRTKNIKGRRVASSKKPAAKAVAKGKTRIKKS